MNSNKYVFVYSAGLSAFGLMVYYVAEIVEVDIVDVHDSPSSQIVYCKPVTSKQFTTLILNKHEDVVYMSNDECHVIGKIFQFDGSDAMRAHVNRINVLRLIAEDFSKTITDFLQEFDAENDALIHALDHG